MLLVDDDPTIVNAVARLFASAGHRAIGCHDTRSAREQLTHTRVDVVITDWQLGSEDSGELIRELHTRCPEVRVIVLSGNLDHVPGDLGVTKVQKPAGPIELLALVRGADSPTT